MEAVREPAPDEKRQMHIDLWKDEIGKYVLMPGAPERVELIARKLKDPRPLRISREFASWIGELAGEKITVISNLISASILNNHIS